MDFVQTGLTDSHRTAWLHDAGCYKLLSPDGEIGRHSGLKIDQDTLSESDNYMKINIVD